MSEAAAPQTDAKPPARKRSRWMLAVWVALGVLFGLVAFYLYLLMRVPRLADRWEAEARAELDALLGEPVPDEENAAILYREAMKATVEIPEDINTYSIMACGKWGPKEMSQTRRIVKANAKALVTLHDAQRRPGCDWDSEHAGDDIDEDLLSVLLCALHLRARLEASEGKANDAARDIRAHLRLCHEMTSSLEDHLWYPAQQTHCWTIAYNVPPC